MNHTERKKYIIEGEEFEFNIAIENKDFLFVIANINLTLNESAFRKVENSTEILKKILFHFLFEKLKKYTILKTANIETETEFQGVFEIKDILNFQKKMTRTVQLNNSEEQINVIINVEKEFKECINYVQNPINDSEVFISSTKEIFDELVLSCFIEENEKMKITVSGNSGETIIRKATDELFLEKFGHSFIADLIGERFCNHYELQQKFKIVPKIFE
jgi:hypothetical protein